MFQHEGDGENTEHLQSMDLHDVKTALEKDAELDEVCSHLIMVVTIPNVCAYYTCVLCNLAFRVSGSLCPTSLAVKDYELLLIWLQAVAEFIFSSS